MSDRQKLLTILGPTASGKSECAVELAKEFGGEVVSADSRQVYKGLDIGSGKISRDEAAPTTYNLPPSTFFHKGIPHHLLDIAEPQERVSVADFKARADQAIADILARGKLPIVAGGTGYYIQAVVDNITPPKVEPNEKLRAELEQKPANKLLSELQTLDPTRAATIDPHNPRRLIRAIEIATALGHVPPQEAAPQYDALQVGLDIANNALEERVSARVAERLARGWVAEVAQLHKAGVSWERLREFGLGYRCVADFLEKGGADDDKLHECIATSERQYAKRQRTWFKRDKRIQWFAPEEQAAIVEAATSFLAGV